MFSCNFKGSDSSEENAVVPLGPGSLALTPLVLSPLLLRSMYCDDAVCRESQTT